MRRAADRSTNHERAGFSRRGPVIDYPDKPYSVFYRMRLVPDLALPG